MPAASSKSKPNTEKDTPRRLPKAPSPLLGPINLLRSNYQLSRAQTYCDYGMEYVQQLVEEHNYAARPEYYDLVGQSKMVNELIDDMLTQPKWTLKESRDLKRQSKRFHASAFRTSRQAKQAYLEQMEIKSPEPEEGVLAYSRPSTPCGPFTIGFRHALIEAITQSDLDPSLLRNTREGSEPSTDSTDERFESQRDELDDASSASDASLMSAVPVSST
ncbi:hypothetical protein C8Q74DRAFT_1259441 [Fomes fomentarius]|nr:hypothetical protein C8Q74DRAFT_1259441 [Fomes fomentarius]